MTSFKKEGYSSPPTFWAKAVDELNKGRDAVATLAGMLLPHRPMEEHGPESSAEARLLIEEIMEKISRAITDLSSGNKKYEHLIAMSSSPDASAKDSVMRRKMQSTIKSATRKRGNPYSWTTTSTTLADGHIWRKYGQKEIFTAKYPRSYYRCTYKHGRGCMATRQVQQSEEDSSLYVITYFGEHTCEKTTKNVNASRAIISFESNMTIGVKPDTPFHSIPPHRQENEEDVLSSLSSIDSPSGCIMLQEQEPSSALQSSISSHDLEILDLENLLNFEHDEIFQW